LPTGELVAPLAVTVPSGVSVVHSVNFALKHTWSGDVQIVLESPSGVLYNIVQLNDGNFGGGCFSDFFGVYDVVDPIAGNVCGGVASFGCGANVIAPGTYLQEFGAWPSGSAGIVNVPIEQIPLASGTWKLHLYDWYVAFDNGALLNWEMCFGQPTVPPPPPPVTMQCVTGGASGAYPTSTTLNGTWDAVLPTDFSTSPLSVSVPAGATKIVAVKLNGLTHTWSGDSDFVLQDPSGNMYNLLLMSDINTTTGGGCGDDFNGDYVIVDANVGQSPCGGPAPSFVCSGNAYPSGTYLQSFSTWTSGNAGVFNTPLESIPMASGTWNLLAFDWYQPADVGSFTSWDLCFDLPSGPTAFCTAGTSTNGCVPSITANAQPSATQATAPLITVNNVEGQRFGIIFYGINQTGFTPSPWAVGSSSYLCVKGPTQRTGTSNSGGAVNACNGALALNWNAFITANPGAVGNPFSAGDKVYVQGWYRDPPAPKTTNLSNALELTVQP
jgi:subtilisin-like proprotein convertase family protein